MINTVDLTFTPCAPAVAELHITGRSGCGYYQGLALQVCLLHEAQFQVWWLRQGTALHLQGVLWAEFRGVHGSWSDLPARFAASLLKLRDAFRVLPHLYLTFNTVANCTLGLFGAL